MEANEINEFAEQAKEAGEKSLTHVSLIISTLAVLVAMVTVLGHREHTEATLMQTRAGDKWNEYQARKMRLEMTQKISDMLTLQPSSNDAAVQKTLESYKGQMERWTEELKEAQVSAQEYEEKVEVAEAKAARYDLGEALLQISVVLASITLLTRKQLYVAAAVLLGLAGLLVAGSGLLLH